MISSVEFFENVSLLITHYNRSESLERLLNAFKNLNIEFGEIVVSDDCSSLFHLNRLHELQDQFDFKLITTPLNGGLGHNINKGQDAVTKAYTLYIQEDFVPLKPFKEHFSDALVLMEQDKHWDLITFYSYEPYPYLRPYRKGFSEKIFHRSPFYSNHLKFYLYGDHPHLRKSTFLDKFGRYKEGLDGDKTEMEMSLSFIRKKGRSLFFDNLHELLDQVNSADEPSTASFRKPWKQRKSFVISLARFLYLKTKYIKLYIKLLTQ